MFLLDDVVVYSASDLVSAATCESATLRQLDAKLGRATLEQQEDPLLKRTAALGDAHERRVLDDFVALHGGSAGDRADGVVEIKRPSYNRAGLEASARNPRRAPRRSRCRLPGVILRRAVPRASGLPGAKWRRLRRVRHQACPARQDHGSAAARRLCRPTRTERHCCRSAGAAHPRATTPESAHAVIDLLPVYRERPNACRRSSTNTKAHPRPSSGTTPGTSPAVAATSVRPKWSSTVISSSLPSCA